MLTVRTSAHIHTNRHRGDFRLCRASTGAPRVGAGISRLLAEWCRLCNAESRRIWLKDGWTAHMLRVQTRKWRRQR
jgi:hypothetical protein